MKILAINPGSTSTKIAVYKDLNEFYSKTIRHDIDVLDEFPNILAQYEFRKRFIITSLKEAEIKIEKLDAIVGRGGLLKPIPGGVYRVNDLMIDDLHKEILGEHASNLGAIIVQTIVRESGVNIPSFIVDPVVIDEFEDIARLSGHPELPRISIFHALNQKATARRFAREHNKKYEDLNLIVVHLGGGVSVGAHSRGRVIDVNNALNGEGPYSPERSGTLPIGALAKLCYSGKHQYHEIKTMITGKGGMVAYLHTNNANDVEKMISTGDEYAELVFEGIAYQTAKEVGSQATVLKGKIDGIILTGGLAHSKRICDWITERVSFMAPVFIYPGEDEMRALAESAYYALIGELPIKEYV